MLGSLYSSYKGCNPLCTGRSSVVASAALDIWGILFSVHSVLRWASVLQSSISCYFSCPRAPSSPGLAAWPAAPLFNRIDMMFVVCLENFQIKIIKLRNFFKHIINDFIFKNYFSQVGKDLMSFSIEPSS